MNEVVGILIGALLGTFLGMGLVVENDGRIAATKIAIAECEKDLPRSKSCKWVITAELNET
tara:strand:- start:10876 stop:11058 length:183 start_codon:yes stop_codon:yes gene_type:complete